MNELMSGYSRYTSAAAYGSSLAGDAPATTSPACAVGTIVILTVGVTC
ncbi:LxmA leader domain family RiPP [Rathayibacter toxicus]|nr:LxmA leader domain family RiPP [Rathayibacter toxicus]